MCLYNYTRTVAAIRSRLWLQCTPFKVYTDEATNHLFSVVLVLFYDCDLCVYRSVWKCCAATVNKTSRGGISVIALYMTWQLTTAKIYLKTSVSGLLCECVSLRVRWKSVLLFY